MLFCDCDSVLLKNAYGSVGLLTFNGFFQASVTTVKTRNDNCVWTWPKGRMAFKM